jgi:hypothetical protein
MSTAQTTDSQPSQLRFGRFTWKLPGKRWQRVALGIVLTCGGLLGFLPVLGFWMLPLGILVLSVDFHPIRRLRRRFDVWRLRRAKRRKEK